MNNLHVRIFTRYTPFYAMTDLTTNNILPVGGFLFAYFAGWVLKISPEEKKIISQNKKTFKGWYFLPVMLRPQGF